jgi:hypothetical protein
MNEAVEGERQASACGTTRKQELSYLGPHTGLFGTDFALTRFLHSIALEGDYSSNVI